MAEQSFAAVIQLQSTDDLAGNLARAGRIMEQAVAEGAGLLVLPENFSYLSARPEDRGAHREDPVNGPSVAFLKEFAQRHRVWLVGGSIPLATDDPRLVTNTCLLVDEQGRISARYDKIHLFDVNLGKGEQHRESEVVRAGKEPVVADTPFGRLGLAICYDLRFPELFRALSRMGAELISLPSAFTVPTGKDHWEVLVRARAVENFCYLLAAGQWGEHPGNRRTYGHSMIVEPWGGILASQASGEGYLIAPLDPKRVASCRTLIPCLTHRVL